MIPLILLCVYVFVCVIVYVCTCVRGFGVEGREGARQCGISKAYGKVRGTVSSDRPLCLEPLGVNKCHSLSHPA